MVKLLHKVTLRGEYIINSKVITKHIEQWRYHISQTLSDEVARTEGK